jgi:hypothetical protein
MNECVAVAEGGGGGVTVVVVAVVGGCRGTSALTAICAYLLSTKGLKAHTIVKHHGKITLSTINPTGTGLGLNPGL